MIVAVLEDGGGRACSCWCVSWSRTLNRGDGAFRVVLWNILVQVFFGSVACLFFFVAAVRIVGIAWISRDVIELTFVACGMKIT